MKRKKGMELAVNMLVVVILGIVMLGAGIFIFMKVMNSTGKVSDIVDENQQKLIEDSMINGCGTICIPFATKDNVPRGELASFNMGIENLFDEPHTFRIKVTGPTATGTTTQESLPHYVNENNEVTINPHEREYKKLNIFVPKNAPIGQHIFTIKICYNTDPTNTDAVQCPEVGFSSPYPPLQKVYVVVK
jgi:hypothetical protein